MLYRLNLDSAITVQSLPGAVVQQVRVEPPLHGDPGERVVVDERGPEVGEVSGLDAAVVLGEEVARDEEVDDGVAQELQPLVAVGQLLVRGVGAVREGLPQKGPLPEIVTTGRIQLQF